jgi:pimeloyl-ACP methyl ester carboxylesterase
VEITGGDGLTLAGWYRPGDRQAAVIVAHAFRLNGTSMLGHARPLAERGFGVLLLDLRAHGRSQGDTSTPGWREAGDLLAAVDFLKGQVPRGPRQVGVLGISLGGQAALYAAAESNEIGAVVAEGPGPSGRRDLNIETSSLAGWLRNPIRQLSYALLVFMSGEQAAVGLTEAIQTISPRPVLLISAGQGHERSWLRRLARVAPEAVELWELPEAGHGGGLLAYPQLYGQKVASFFEASLPKGQS